jgi:hypothetical protein
MLRDYTENLLTDTNMPYIPGGSKVSYGLGSWVIDTDSNN